MSDPLQFTLTIDRIEPELLLENRPAHIFFSLTNFSGAQTNGAVQADLFMGAPYYAPAESTGPWLVKLENGETGTGVLTLTPPTAGKSLSLVLFYYTAPNVAARAEVLVDVAARYTIGLSGFKAETLRGGDHDELHIMLSLGRPDSPETVSLQADGIFVTGDEAARGVQRLLTGLTVDRIDVAPGSGSRYGVSLSFVVLNIDTQNTQLIDVLNELSDLGDAIASGFVPGDAMMFLNARMHTFHQTLLAGCNGLIAADRLWLTGHQLNEWTASIDSHSETKRYVAPDRSSPIGCSDKFSVYDITYTIERQRQRLASEFLPVYPQSKVLSPGQSQIYYTDPNAHGQIDSNVTWSVIGPSDIYGTIDRNSGAYLSPVESDWRTVVIIRAFHKDGRRGSAFARILPRQTPSIQVLGRVT